MAQEKIACPFCGGWVTVGAVCEYCGSFVSSMSSLGRGRTQANGEKKKITGSSMQEMFRTVQNAENGKWGVLDSDGLQIVPFEYDSVCIKLPFVLIGKKVSLQNKEEKLLLGTYSLKLKKILVPIEYDKIYVKSYRLEDGECFRLQTTKYVFTTTKYDVLKKDYRYGLYNGDDGMELLPCKYRFSYDLCDRSDRYLIFDENDKKGLCDVWNGKLMFPCIYKTICLKGKYAEVTEDKYRGLYDISGDSPIQVLPIIYEEIHMTDNWLLIKKQYWGISNYVGEVIIPCLYDKIEYDGVENLKLYFGETLDSLYYYYRNPKNAFLQIKINEGKVTKGDRPKGIVLNMCIGVLQLIVFILFFISMFTSFEIKKAFVALACLIGAFVSFHGYFVSKKYRVNESF